jgi:hypothetical protein
MRKTPKQLEEQKQDQPDVNARIDNHTKEITPQSSHQSMRALTMMCELAAQLLIASW